MKRFALIFVSLLSITLPSFAQSPDSGLVTVMVTGTGADVPSAKKDAYRTAIQKVVGNIKVELEILVENDAVIRDQMLTYSSAYVESAEVLGDPVVLPGGLVRVRIKAVIRKKKLEDKLRASVGSSSQLEGEGLFAEMLSRQDQWGDATNVIRSVFEDFPLKVLTISVLGNDRGKPALELDQRTGDVTVPVCISVDANRYKKAIGEIYEKIGPMAKTLVWSTRDPDDEAPAYIDEESKANGYHSYSFHGLPHQSREYVFVSVDMPSRRGFYMEFDKNTFHEITQYFYKTINGSERPTTILIAEVSIKDSKDEIIRAGHMVVEDNVSYIFMGCHAFVRDYWGEGISILPLPVVDPVSGKYASSLHNQLGGISVSFPEINRENLLLKEMSLFAKVPMGEFSPEELRRAAKVESYLWLCDNDKREEILREARKAREILTKQKH